MFELGKSWRRRFRFTALQRPQNGTEYLSIASCVGAIHTTNFSCAAENKRIECIRGQTGTQAYFCVLLVGFIPVL